MCECDAEAHLDHGQQALVGGGVCGDGEAPSGVSGHDAVHGGPSLGVRLVFVRHRQIGNNHIDAVLLKLPGELREKEEEEEKCNQATLQPPPPLKPTVSAVNSGGLSLTSVIRMRVVAVLDRP